jgi:hypothetical protein
VVVLVVVIVVVVVVVINVVERGARSVPGLIRVGEG